MKRDPVRATWDSECPVCLEPISKGDWLLGWSPRWGHADCVETQLAKDVDDPQERAPRQIRDCPRWTPPIIRESNARWCELCGAKIDCHHRSSSGPGAGDETEVGAE